MSKQKKYIPTAAETRQIRRQQILFTVVAAVMILAMVVSLIKF